MTYKIECRKCGWTITAPANQIPVRCDSCKMERIVARRVDEADTVIMNAEIPEFKCPECNWRGRSQFRLHGMADLPPCPECYKRAAWVLCRPDTAPPPLSAKGLGGNEGGFTTGAVDESEGFSCSDEMTRIQPGKNSDPFHQPEPNDRLCAAIAAVLMRDDLTPEARTLVEGALRAQRGCA